MSDRYRPGCCVDKACTPNTCMKLPDEYTCGDCGYFAHCERMYDKLRASTHCDFFPRRFVIGQFTTGATTGERAER